jgi:hypothetical protein
MEADHLQISAAAQKELAMLNDVKIFIEGYS